MPIQIAHQKAESVILSLFKPHLLFFFPQKWPGEIDGIKEKVSILQEKLEKLSHYIYRILAISLKLQVNAKVGSINSGIGS